MYVIGTAGHIDHGKSQLVIALTGIDPDRLREEKERGMTIDLGFAWMTLPSGKEVGIVDVPGHERLIKNMLAGVGGIDLALIIIAANEGVMPQTREHLAILDLLQITKGIVVITKKDLVDADYLAVVKLEVEELLSATSLAGSPIAAVSSITGEGIPELKKIIDEILNSLQPKKDIGRPRLPIDRVFTLPGVGTIVTGTLVEGCLTAGQEVELMPSGLKSRIRSLQTHKARVETATPGSRVGVNLVGIATENVKRGDVLTRPGWLNPTTLITVNLKLIPYLTRPLHHGAEIGFYTGTAEAMAKLRLLGSDELKPGETGWGQLVLDRPTALTISDHFIIRSPMETIGGGRIYESHTNKYRRFRQEILDSLAVKAKGTGDEVIQALLDAKSPLEMTDLVAKSNMEESEVKEILDSLVQQGRAVVVHEAKSSMYFSASGWDALQRKAIQALNEYHQKFPARPGVPVVEMGSRLKIGDRYQAIIQHLVDEGTIIKDMGTVMIPSFRISFTQAQQSKIEAFLKALEQHPYTPPTDTVLEPDLLNLLVSQKKVVKLSEDIVFSAAAYDQAVETLTNYLKAKGKVTVGEVRDMFGTSRKYALALLEYLDRIKLTRRVGDDRVLV
jgi:selenocysteine-specific elongation factor